MVTTIYCAKECENIIIKSGMTLCKFQNCLFEQMELIEKLDATVEQKQFLNDMLETLSENGQYINDWEFESILEGEQPTIEKCSHDSSDCHSPRQYFHESTDLCWSVCSLAPTWWLVGKESEKGGYGFDVLDRLQAIGLTIPNVEE